MPGRPARPDVVKSLFIVIACVPFLLAGLFFILVGSVSHRAATPYRQGVTTTGTVTSVQIEEDLTNRRRTTYRATYTFATADGTVYSFTDLRAPAPTIGSRIVVSYRPTSPERARRIPESDWESRTEWGVGGAVTAIAAFFLVSLVWRLARRSDDDRLVHQR